MLRAEMCFLDAKRVPGESKRLIACRPAVQDQRSHQNVERCRKFQGIVAVRGSQTVDLSTSRRFGLLVHTFASRTCTSRKIVRGRVLRG